MTNLYWALALTALCIGAWLRYDHVMGENERLERELTNIVATRETELREQTAANERARVNQQTLTEIRNENERISKCIADKSCGYVVRNYPTNCPVPSTATSRPDANAGTPRPDDVFQRTVQSLEESIKLRNAQIAGLKADVLIRSAPDYCSNKKSR